ncbi:MAG: UvrD-helicase domain-containing protein, partial [Desulfomonilia bacterium]|nr:UvrD-helicase domain-containing protein [Desulfomonilia bacterium]
MRPAILDGLNPEQRKAVCYERGPLLIFAGAGSGKTRVIVHRAAYLIENGVAPSDILCLTFTNKAAQEMKTRLTGILGTETIGVWAGTFHAFGAWFLRHEAHHMGYTRSFQIYDEADQRSLIAKCMKELNLKTERGFDSTIAWIANISRDTLRDISKIPHRLRFDPLPVIALYEQKKRDFGVFDFADLLSVPTSVLGSMPQLRARYQDRFRHILVDEYQDTNTAQYALLMQLISKETNITVVGDDDQSIYGWRGADVGNILRFKDDFPQAEVVVLEQNYRSTEDILEAASSLIANNKYREPKQLRSARGKGRRLEILEFSDDEHETASLAHTVDELISSGVSPPQIGVFYRVNALSRLVEESFVRRGIPYKVYGGMRFYERREIKDVLAYLRIIANPKDEEALSRCINTPPRGIGEKTLSELQRFARSRGKSTALILKEALEHSVVRGAAARGISGFLSLIEACMHEGTDRDIADMIEMIMQRSGMMRSLEGELDGPDRLMNIRELISSASGQTDLTGYLEEKALMNSLDVDAGDAVSVMTLHMSKGLEFDHVFIIGVEEGLLPHSRSMDTALDIEEERRLLYVGITRARRDVVLSWSRVRALYGRE